MTRICVFAKPPVAGNVKMRLAARIGAAAAAELASAFLSDTWSLVHSIPNTHAVLSTTQPFDTNLRAEVWLQGEGDLGARLERTLARALADAHVAVALGADTPGLPATTLLNACTLPSSYDAAICPAEDGGFCLLALRRCPPGLLAGLPWSTSDTCAATLARMRQVGLNVCELDAWFDIDEWNDLMRLRLMLHLRQAVAPCTRAWMQRNRELFEEHACVSR